MWCLPTQCPWRQFSLRFSAVEIYNEVVRDLLDSSLGPLRLLDDPEVRLLGPGIPNKSGPLQWGSMHPSRIKAQYRGRVHRAHRSQ